ncbi:MAG: NADH-quinone oxidoreductase subunit J [Desulfohalobiaceae bacterium]|nr:NADH-quinone oxidoreductase subunit J [Desulfohalobiaceae bacterium]
MTLLATIFYILAAIVLVATGLAVTRRDPIHAVVYLIVSFVGTALIFFLLGAPLLAVFEVIIYAGAVMVLFCFIIMTLGGEALPGEGGLLRQWAWPLLPGLVSLLAGGVLLFAAPEAGTRLAAAMASPSAFGRFLFNHYWLAIEAVSLLLFVALAGALYLARPKDKTPANDSGEGHDRSL